LQLEEQKDEPSVSGQLGESLLEHRSTAKLIGQVLGTGERLARQLEQFLGRNLTAAHAPAYVSG
jgi:hypothetical protein